MRYRMTPWRLVGGLLSAVLGAAGFLLLAYASALRNGFGGSPVPEGWFALPITLSLAGIVYCWLYLPLHGAAGREGR